MDFVETGVFAREFKRLRKKYKTLDEDFDVLQSIIRRYPNGNNSQHWNLLTEDSGCVVLKMRMMCRSLRGASLRVVYLYDEQKCYVQFIEIYYKGNKDREDEDLYRRTLVDYLGERGE